MKKNEERNSNYALFADSGSLSNKIDWNNHSLLYVYTYILSCQVIERTIMWQNAIGSRKSDVNLRYIHNIEISNKYM